MGVPRPLDSSIESLYFSMYSVTSRWILRRVAGDSLKTLAVAANVAGLNLRRTRFLAMPSRY